MANVASTVPESHVHGRGRILFLDGWRGLAILAVLLGHYVGVPGIQVGRFGVELFFVLSGRLMAEILFVERFPLPEFFKRRVARIWPALFVFILASAALFGGTGLLKVDLLHIVAALTFTINYLGAPGMLMPIYDHIWSLCVEEWAYVLLGLLAFIVRRKTWDVKWVIAAVAVACMINGAVQTALGGSYYEVYWRTDVRVASILAGAAVYLHLRETRVPAWLPLAAGAIGFLLNTSYVPDVVKYSLGAWCLAITVATLSSAPRLVLAVLQSPVLVRIGLWSFSLYLWQQPFYKLIGRFPTVGLLAAAIVCGLASFYLVEQPARRWINSMRKARRLAPEAA